MGLIQLRKLLVNSCHWGLWCFMRYFSLFLHIIDRNVTQRLPIITTTTIYFSTPVSGGFSAIGGCHWATAFAGRKHRRIWAFNRLLVRRRHRLCVRRRHRLCRQSKESEKGDSKGRLSSSGLEFPVRVRGQGWQGLPGLFLFVFLFYLFFKLFSNFQFIFKFSI